MHTPSATLAPRTDALSVLAERVAVDRDGRLRYTRCPHCNAPMHYAHRERDYSHEWFGRCLNDACNYAAWLPVIDAEIWSQIEAVTDGQVAA